MPSPILSLGLDPMLLATRNELLRREGYEVFSTFDYSKVLACAAIADVVVLGHSIPFPLRAELASLLREQYPELPIVAMCDPLDEKCVPDANYCLFKTSPEQLLQSIAACLKHKDIAVT